MILKIKELATKCLILGIDNGIYTIDIQGTRPEIINDMQFNTLETETLESLEAMDYSLEEMCEKLEKIYKLLNN